MSFEINKILASLLTALIVGMVSGIIAQSIIYTPKLKKDAFPIAAATSASTAAETAPAEEKATPIPTDVLVKADPAKGADIAKKCAQCHDWTKGGPNKIGPNLWGVIGRAKASEAGFTYSDALKKLGGNWTPQDIAAFIFKPSAYAPGTKMTFPGLPKADERADVLAFLNSQSDHAVDLTK